ncbi:MAG: fimbrial protein FimV, partial [Polaromonas sp.]|nr:fimbrial protein FimV [Polaromonas sp.]
KPVPTTAVEPMKRPDFTPTPTAPVAPTHEPDPEPTVALQTKREPAFGKPGMDSGSGKTMPVSLAAAADSGLLEFDMGSLSLDLNGPITESPALARGLAVAVPAAPQGPLETKFALAEEFRALGDSDGARSLASEVFAQADGALKSKAQAFLNALS